MNCDVWVVNGRTILSTCAYKNQFRYPSKRDELEALLKGLRRAEAPLSSFLAVPDKYVYMGVFA